MGPICQSACLSVHPCAFLHDGWMDCLHIWYCDQVPQAADAHKIEFGSMPHFSNYGNFFHMFCVCCDISEKYVLILFT